MPKKQATVERFARTAPTLEGVSVELALAALYDEEAGVAVASRSTLAHLTHYSEKRVRTQVKALARSNRWQVTSVGSKAKVFQPVI